MNQKEWDRMIGQELYNPFNVHDDSFQGSMRRSGNSMLLTI